MADQYKINFVYDADPDDIRAIFKYADDPNQAVKMLKHCKIKPGWRVLSVAKTGQEPEEGGES